MRRIRIRAGEAEITARLRDTPTADALWAALPLEGNANTWGEEVYFATPVAAQLEPDARDVVEPGELAFWVQGQAVAIGFGPTPISRQGEIRLAAPTNIWADAEQDVRRLVDVHDGAPVRVEALAP